jgi:hypothetical protein
MKLLSERIGQELRWIKPKVLHAEYELREGDEVFGRIVGKGRWLSAIEIETASDSWRVEQKGSCYQELQKRLKKREKDQAAQA